MTTCDTVRQRTSRWFDRLAARAARAPGATVSGVLLASCMGLATGCSGTPSSSDGANAAVKAVAAVAQIAADVTDQEAPMATAAAHGKNLGFDTSVYPGTRTMGTWKSTPGAPYHWVGYYLPSPCHKDASWLGKRDTLTRMGWGLAVVYVGQQTWGKTPRPLTAGQRAALLTLGKSCNADLVAPDRGAIDGADAVARTAREGFAAQSTVFLDIERTERMPDAMRAYYRAWANALLTDGRYRPGVYVHAHNAAVVYADLKAAYVRAGLTDEPRVWVASGRGFDTGKAPQDVGFAFAGVWQGILDVGRAVANLTLPVDINVSKWRSPSAPGTTATD
jgi:hypothetical protein